MIEVESKFIASPEIMEKLLKNSSLVKEEFLIDQYFDTVDLKLMSKDMWLRKRNGRLELKIPIRKHHVDGVKSYEEVEGEEVVLLRLKELSGLSWEDCSMFAEIKKYRRKFQLGEFILDFDEADFGDAKYLVSEIELMVEEQQRGEAELKIRDIAGQYSLELAKVRGSLMEYLFRYKQEFYQKAKAAREAYKRDVLVQDQFEMN